MFNRKLRPKTDLEKAHDRALTELDAKEVTSEEYGTILDRAAKLHKMKEEENPDSISKETLLRVGANLLGILLIIHHERVNIVTSKALPFVQKP